MKQTDFLQELGYLGFTMRLKRISDALLQDGRKLYQGLSVDIEPNWFSVFKLLEARGGMTVMHIAESLMMAHPSIIAITNKMLAKGYLISEKHSTDSRKRILNLSEKAIAMLPVFQNIWDSGETGMEEVLEPYNALELITRLEEVFFEKGFRDRTLEKLHGKDNENS